MESIDDKSGFFQPFFYHRNIGLGHIAAGELDFRALVLAQLCLEEFLQRLATFSGAHPDYFGAFQVIDNGGVLVPLTVGDLVNTHVGQVSDLMVGSLSVDDVVYQIRYRRLRNTKKFCCRLLCHLLSEAKKRILEAITDPGKIVGPGNLFLYPAMSGTKDLLGSIEQKHLDAVNGNVPPLPLQLRLIDDLATKSALGASTAILVRLDHNGKGSITIKKLEIGYLENVLEPEKLTDKLGCIQMALSLLWG